MLTEDFVRWKRVAAAATLAILLAPGTAGAQSAADPHATYLLGNVGNTTAAQPVAAGTASAQGSGSMGGVPMGTTPAAGAPMGDDDHAAHHPDATDSMPASSGASMGGSMGGMMDDMMRGCRGDECGRDRRLNKLLYPQLMALPDLPPERRASVEQLAHHRMHEGIQLLASLSSEEIGRASCRERV